MKRYNVIGIMSGTSLDGLDIAYCNFLFSNNRWHYNILHAETIEYKPSWRQELQKLETLSGRELWAFHTKFGHFIGKQVDNFIKKHNLTIDFVCSHGHTVFHQPHLGFTSQIGDGASIAAECKKSVICDFRSTDVALGGQGAPLVPIGDKLLFDEYEFCLNIGGICNISFDKNGKRIAWDIAPANMILNYYASKINISFDEDGKIAEGGKTNIDLLNNLNNINYYKIDYPKSLGREYVFKHFVPLIDKYNLSISDILNTITEHISLEIAHSTNFLNNKQILITGGGALNKFLIKRIQFHNKNKIIIPDKNIIDFKEALIFAFLGVLRFENKINCLKEVTGALEDNIGGAIYSYC